MAKAPRNRNLQGAQSAADAKRSSRPTAVGGEAIVPTTSDYLAQLLASAPKDVLDINNSMQFNDEVKYVRVNIPIRDYPNGVEIYHLTDVQFGHVLCNVRRVIEYRDWILDKPNRFVLFGGDNIDAAHQLSVASPYENTMQPSDQVLRFCETFMPIRHRILGYVGGNHERRSLKMFGSAGQMIATLLQIPYSAGLQFVDITYGGHKPYRISLWHGKGASQTKGAKAQMISRFMEQGDSQLYLVGHLHDAIALWAWRALRKDGKIKLVKIAGVMSTSFLEYFGTYAEVTALTPSDVMMARVILTPNGKWELTMR